MSSFIGQHLNTLDDKGRLNIPARFRRNLTPESNDTFVIAQGKEGCLDVYPLNEWVKVEKFLKTLNINNPRHRRYIRMVTSNATHSPLDRQGRINIPSILSEMAEIKKEVLVVGTLYKLEMWNPEKFQAYMDESTDSFEDLAEDIDFSLPE